MKIKFQQGGAFTPPFAVYQPFIVPNAEERSTRSSKKSDEEDNDMKMKDIYGLLSDLKDAIPGDITAVSGQLGVLFNNIERKLNAPTTSLFGGTSSIASEYIKILKIVNNLNFQANAFKDAKKIAEDRKSLSEVVINSTGKVMVTDGDGFDWITPEEYFKNREDYSPITNAQLLDFRSKGISGLAFNYNSLEAVAGSIGMEDITKMITDAISDLQSDSVKETGYVESKKLLQGLEDYLAAKEKSGNYNASIEDLYKGTLLTENQARSAKQALVYIYNSLPANALTLLKMKSDGTTKGALQLVDSLVYSKTKTKNEFDLALEGGPSTKSSDNNQETNIEDSFLWRVQQNLGTHYGTIKINNNSNQSLTLNGAIFEQILTPDNKHIGDNSIENMLNNSHLRSITIGKAYFGNQLISEEDMRKIMYKGDGLMRTNIPVADDGKPAFELLDLWESFKLDQELVKTPAKELIKQDKYKKLRSYFNNDGSWNKDKVKPFILFNGMTTDGLINIEPKNKFVIDKDTSADMIERIKLGLSTKIGSDMIYPEIDEQNWYEPFGIQYDHVYEGVVFMPIHMNKNSSILNQGVDLGITYNIEQEYQNSIKPDYQATNINMLK